jgi:hypothetical protein
MSHRLARLLAPLGAATLLLATNATAAAAQFTRTGASVSTKCGTGIAKCDNNWSVTWRGFGAGALGVSGTLAKAAIVTTIPTPVWAPNVAGQQQWIGVSSNADVATVHTGDNASRYHYFFSTLISAPISSFDFGMGWDNRLLGVYTGNLTINSNGTYSGGTSILDVTSYAGKSGFCRDGDGVLPTSNAPSKCLVPIDINGANVAVGARLTFVIEGDGETDGLLVGSPTAPITATPEPATLALLGTGLLGLGGFALRKRSKRSKR